MWGLRGHKRGKEKHSTVLFSTHFVVSLSKLTMQISISWWLISFWTRQVIWMSGKDYVWGKVSRMCISSAVAIQRKDGTGLDSFQVILNPNLPSLRHPSAWPPFLLSFFSIAMCLSGNTWKFTCLWFHERILCSTELKAAQLINGYFSRLLKLQWENLVKDQPYHST